MLKMSNRSELNLKRLVFLLVFSATGGGSSFADSDFLRVSVECPAQAGDGLLETIDANTRGGRSRVSTFYVAGKMQRVVVSSSKDGGPFHDVFALDRAK